MSSTKLAASEKAELTVERWGSTLSVAGRLDRARLGQIVRQVIETHGSAAPLAAVCDYREADVGMSARVLYAAAARSGGAKLDWPTALVATPSQLAIWRQYAYLQGMRGCLRGVFTELEPARAWAIEHAGLRYAHFKSRGRG